MKADSFHSVFSDKHAKYNQFISSQLFSGYKVRGKDNQKKQYLISSPSGDQKMTNNFTASQSYLNAMKALQEKIKSLELENLSLQTLVSSNDNKSDVKQNDLKLKETSLHLKTNETVQIKGLEQKLMQQEFTNKMKIEDYECKLAQLQHNLLNIAQQADQKFREYIEEIQNLNEQLRIQEENNQNYRNKINSYTQTLQQEKQVNITELKITFKQHSNFRPLNYSSWYNFQTYFQLFSLLLSANVNIRKVSQEQKGKSKKLVFGQKYNLSFVILLASYYFVRNQNFQFIL